MSGRQNRVVGLLGREGEDAREVSQIAIPCIIYLTSILVLIHVRKFTVKYIMYFNHVSLIHTLTNPPCFQPAIVTHG